MFRREIDIFHDRDVGKEAIGPGDEPPAQNIGGNHTQHIEKDEEDDDPEARDGKLKVKQKLGHLRSQRAEEVVECVEDEFEDEESDPERKDHQDACKDLCPEMLENVLHRRSGFTPLESPAANSRDEFVFFSSEHGALTPCESPRCLEDLLQVRLLDHLFIEEKTGEFSKLFFL